jgi:cyclopropane-fatty-acyl-phospholipid synthase
MGLSTRNGRLSPATSTHAKHASADPRVRVRVDRPPDDLQIVTEPEPGSVAHTLRPLAVAILGDPLPIRVEVWDGSCMGPLQGPGTLRVTPRALRHLLWSPDQLGVGRAYVAGDLEVEGDLLVVLRTLDGIRDGDLRFALRTLTRGWRAARLPGVLGAPPAPPPEEIRPRGRRHSLRRDRQAVSHHYDVGNEFYEIVLGPAMTYSCARFSEPGMTLADAQADKHELICRKLGLHVEPGRRLLDVGCGWGSLALHAASHHGARVVGITISREQAVRARDRVRDAGLDALIDIRLQDYRELSNDSTTAPFDAIASVGMFEHVGSERMRQYFEVLHGLLTPTGRLLNHAISSVGGSRIGGRSFVHRYVFPDGELIDVGEVVVAMERAGFQVRDVESLREHYATTLRCWVANLQGAWDRAVELVGANRARVWLLYMAASALHFDEGGIDIHQVLGVLPTSEGDSGMPPTRDTWSTSTARHETGGHPAGT